jgi:hypothetical protein
VRVERRIHALAAERPAEGVRGAREADRRRAREEARHHPAPVLQDRRRHGGEIPEDLQKKYGFAPLGAANGPVKNGIFGLNSAKLYNYTPKQQAAVLTDRLARCKETYDREGGDRTNLVYGYINKG